MKTIFLSFTLNNSSVTDFFVTLSNKLADSHRVVIITDKEEKHPFQIAPAITIYKWPSERPVHSKDFVFLIRKIKQYQPTTMIAVFGAVNVFLLGGFFMNVKNRIAWCRTLSSQFTASKNLKFRKKYIYKLATAIFANSAATQKDLQENFSVSKSKIHVIPNAVRSFQAKVTAEKNKIVFVGRLHISKGVDTLIHAIFLVVREFPEIQLTLIGGGALRGKLEEQVRELNLQNHVVFTGQQNREFVFQALAGSYLSVVPSLSEAFGFVVIESFAARTPVIGSNTTGIAEIIRDEVDGYLFEPGNAVDLAEKIVHLLKNQGVRNQFSANCYSHFLENYEIENGTNVLTSKIESLS